MCKRSGGEVLRQDNWKRLQIQVFLGWQQPRHKWRWCAPSWEVGRQSVWHQTSVGQNHVDQITSRGGCPHGIVCLCPLNRIGGVHKGCILRQSSLEETGMDTLDEKQLDMKVFMEVLGMANVMQMVIESLNLLLQMILSLGILSLSKEIVTLSLINLAMQKPRLTSFFWGSEIWKWLKTSR